jgi:GT2 family glycosyltransferase
MPQLTELAAIMNSFNRKGLLELALPSLVSALETLKLPAAIVVFDAGSSDGSREFVAQFAAQHANVELLQLEPAAGQGSAFADGCNQATAEALRRYPGLKWLFFFETDNRLKNPQALRQAIGLLEARPELAGTGFTVEKLDGRKIGFGCRFPGATAFVLGQQLAARFVPEEPVLDAWQTLETGQRWHYADVMYTSPLLVRAEAWKKAGPMDNARFPFTDSDVDLCWTMRDKGWRFAVLDAPGVVHDNCGAPSPWTARRVTYFHQGRFRLLRKHRGAWVALLTVPLLLRHLAEALLLLVAAAVSRRARDSFAVRLSLISKVLRGYEP